MWLGSQIYAPSSSVVWNDVLWTDVINPYKIKPMKSRITASILVCLQVLVCLGSFGQSVSAATDAASSVIPNDTFFSKQWYLNAIHAPQGWTMATGSRDVVVAVIDSGVDTNHPDLKNNIWTNRGEIPNNGIDDDGDGYIDDVHGWNFVQSGSSVLPTPSMTGLEEAYVHGTVVSSLIASSGNDGIGIAGVAWKARIMPLTILDSSGSGRNDDLIRAIAYAMAHGADIINLSLVGYDYDVKLAQAVREATVQGVLVVVAAGNSDVPGGIDMDATPGYPACDKGVGLPGELTVTALDAFNRKASRANYGSCVDVSAPGDGMFAARPTRDSHDSARSAAGYIDGLSGTSIAAPLVSGLAVLLKAEHPSWRGPQIAARIMQTADSVDEQNPLYADKLGHGRINVARALQTDAGTNLLGPLTLEASAAGHAPEVQVLSGTGTPLSRFAVGSAGDKRGVRATFVRWRNDPTPDIAVTSIGDSRGAWQIYTLQGLLIAAGSLGTDIKGGVYLAAADTENVGTDTLFLGEASGTRAWFTSTTMPPQLVNLFPNAHSKGIAALSVTRPEVAFFVSSLSGDGVVSIVGRGGLSLSHAKIPAKDFVSDTRILQRGTRVGQSDVFDLAQGKFPLRYMATASGLDQASAASTTIQWVQAPLGRALAGGWLFYDTWPR